MKRMLGFINVERTTVDHYSFDDEGYLRFRKDALELLAAHGRVSALEVVTKMIGHREVLTSDQFYEKSCLIKAGCEALSWLQDEINDPYQHNDTDGAVMFDEATDLPLAKMQPQRFVYPQTASGSEPWGRGNKTEALAFVIADAAGFRRYVSTRARVISGQKVALEHRIDQSRQLGVAVTVPQLPGFGS